MKAAPIFARIAYWAYLLSSILSLTIDYSCGANSAWKNACILVCVGTSRGLRVMAKGTTKGRKRGTKEEQQACAHWKVKLAPVIGELWAYAPYALAVRCFLLRRHILLPHHPRCPPAHGRTSFVYVYYFSFLEPGFVPSWHSSRPVAMPCVELQARLISASAQEHNHLPRRVHKVHC